MNKRKILVIALVTVLIVLCVIPGMAFAANKLKSTASITSEQAETTALNHAGLKETDVTFLKTRLDREDGRTVYDVEFYNGYQEYDYEIDATTGAIISFDYDAEDYTGYTGTTNANANTGTNASANMSSNTSASANANASAAAITAEQAKETALTHAGLKESDVTFVKAKLDRDDGRLVYDVEFYSGYTEYDYEIDASTGAIISFDYDAEHYNAPAATTNQSSSSNSGSYIGESAAKAIAAGKISGATEADVWLHLDYDDGRAVYEGSCIYGEIKYEFEIRATDGVILEWDAESVYDD